MVALDKEKMLAREWHDKCYGDIDFIFNPDEYVVGAWTERAKLAQDEINKEREQATEYYIDCEHLKAEITELKQKLARYENPDYVLVPRMPTEEMTYAGESAINNCQRINAQDVYKSMIEAVEKNDE